MLLILKIIIKLLKMDSIKLILIRIIIIINKKVTQKIDEVYGNKKLTKYV